MKHQWWCIGGECPTRRVRIVHRGEGTDSSDPDNCVPTTNLRDLRKIIFPALLLASAPSSMLGMCLMDVAQPFLVCALAMVVVCIYLIRIKQQSRVRADGWTSWIPLAARRSRLPTSRTPPRSLSPEKIASTNIPLGGGYQDVFPPSGREALVRVARKSPEAQRSKPMARDIDQAEFQSRLVPFTVDFVSCGPSTYMPTRLSTDEIQALGDFPDYAELSGVPLPEAYKGFRIDKAVPRPYRPLRWAYHQTMCMLTCIVAALF
jgi:hypothetical protein